MNQIMYILYPKHWHPTVQKGDLYHWPATKKTQITEQMAKNATMFVCSAMIAFQENFNEIVSLDNYN